MSDKTKGKIAPEDSTLWKCNWINCVHGCGLAGNGICSGNGEWDNPKCRQFCKIPNHMKDNPKDKTFRQTVEELVYGNHTDTPVPDLLEGECEQCKSLVDRICEAVLKMAEGMPKPAFLGEEHNRAALAHLEECQAYLRKQVE